ncbi:MAG: TonB-dependent copper receptor [Steroidobacteraceae bacterium]
MTAVTAHAADGYGTEEDVLQSVIITATRMESPLMVEANPRSPRQPLPANDGADYLKTVPGFSVIRKGGTDGDPVFRGMAASRINMLLDGEQILGGCGFRMDPPTAYVFPDAYDRIVIVKGPQTVLHGPGNSAATVLFERSEKRFQQPGMRGYGSALAGSADRNDLVADVTFGMPLAYGRLTGTRAQSHDYSDGHGNEVHSGYARWSANATAAWTPDDSTSLELNLAQSDGEAAYADRAMDGAEFARDNIGLHFQRKNMAGMLSGVDVQAYYNYIDHVMDNYSLRPFVPSMMMPGRSVSNPDRRTTGGRIAVDLGDASQLHATLGIDTQENRHRDRSTMNQDVMPYQAMARTRDAWFRNSGAFGEVTMPVAAGQRAIAGARVDRWQARDERSTLSLMMGMMIMPNPTAHAERSDTLTSGFARYERDFTKTTFYAGVGHVERFPDYWELISGSKESAGSLSAFNTRPEKTTQLDVGVVYKSKRLAFSTSVFYSDIQDYILIQSNYAKGMRIATITRNVDARTFGMEADAVYQVTEGLKLTGTLAYTYGDNQTDDKPLAQLAPLEARFGFDYTHQAWSMGALLRGVAAQHRYELNQGNIVGQDLGETAGFGVFSLNTAWRATDAVLVSAGIDNFFDKIYAEHLSKSGSMVSGYTQTTRVNEPGRTLWLKLSASFR